MTTLPAQLANAKALAAKRLGTIRKQAAEIGILRRLKADLEECLARCRERGWEQLGLGINGKAVA